MKSMFQAGSVLPRPFVLVTENGQEEQTETAFFESIDDEMMLEAIEKVAVVGERMNAAASVVQWVHGGESSLDSLDALLYGMAGGEDDIEMTDGQAAMYESLQAHACEFISTISSAQEAELAEMAEDEEVADRIFESLETGLESVDSDEAIAEFAVRESMMLEAKKKVIRDGKVVFINTKKRKRRMSAAQKAALKKARSKANTGAARAARKKSNRMRSARGMK